jgi:hypothetical protein|tara:strand:- start:19 stop:237 length:219 start_codon:yes stop_codon:yes gene_type:complete
MSDIYIKHEIHGGNKIVIELVPHELDDDTSFDIAKIHVVREKTSEVEEEKISIVEVYGDDNKKIKVEVLCRE